MALQKKAPKTLKTGSRLQSARSLPTASPALLGRRLPSTRQQFLETRPPGCRVIGRGAELDPRGAAAGGEVEPLGVEADRPPGGPRGFVPGEPRDRSAAERVDLGEEPRLRLDQRRLALAEARTSVGASASARPKPPLKCTPSIRRRKMAKSANPA